MMTAEGGVNIVLEAPMKVLIVEDDAESRDLLKVLLELDGHDVTAAWNGIEGWQAFQSGEFPVVLSELAPCPRWMVWSCAVGFERAIDRAIRNVILVTALHGKSSYLQGMNACADDFVSKPFDPDELKSRLIVAERIIGVQNRVKHLEGILPTCMYRKIFATSRTSGSASSLTSANVVERRSVMASVRSATRRSSSQNWIASGPPDRTMHVCHPSAHTGTETARRK